MDEATDLDLQLDLVTQAKWKMEEAPLLKMLQYVLQTLRKRMAFSDNVYLPYKTWNSYHIEDDTYSILLRIDTTWNHSMENWYHRQSLTRDNVKTSFEFGLE